jgi:hypothetical protein
VKTPMSRIARRIFLVVVESVVAGVSRRESARSILRGRNCGAPAQDHQPNRNTPTRRIKLRYSLHSHRRSFDLEWAKLFA